MKFLKKIYELNLINEADEAPPPPGASDEPDVTAPSDDVAEITTLSPESEVLYVRLLKKSMVMNINDEDIDNINSLDEVNENNAKDILGKILQIMKSYSTDIDINI